LPPDGGNALFVCPNREFAGLKPPPEAFTVLNISPRKYMRSNQISGSDVQVFEYKAAEYPERWIEGGSRPGARGN
jgi:hypothetical protein